MDFKARIAAKRAARAGAEMKAEAEAAPAYAAIDARGEPFRAAISAALQDMASTEEFARVFGLGSAQETVRRSGKGKSLWAPEVTDWSVVFSNTDDDTFHRLRVEISAGPEGLDPKCTVIAHKNVLGFAFFSPKLDARAETPFQAAELVTEALAEYVVDNTNQSSPTRAPGL